MVRCLLEPWKLGFTEFCTGIASGHLIFIDLILVYLTLTALFLSFALVGLGQLMTRGHLGGKSPRFFFSLMSLC